MNPIAFAAYRRQYHAIDIRLVEQGSKRLEELVLAGELDLAGALLPVGDAFAWREVCREPIDLLIEADHPLAQRAEVALQDLAEQPFILFAEGFALNPIILEACRRSGFEPEIATQSSQIDFVIELAACGLGVAFLPRLIAHQRRHAGVRRVPITDPSMIWRIAMIWRRGGQLPHAAQAWIDLALKARTG